MDVPETQYAKAVDGVSIAYPMMGAGSPLIVFAPSTRASNVEIVWEWSLQASSIGRWPRFRGL